MLLSVDGVLLVDWLTPEWRHHGGSIHHEPHKLIGQSAVAAELPHLMTIVWTNQLWLFQRISKSLKESKQDSDYVKAENQN